MKRTSCFLTAMAFLLACPFTAGYAKKEGPVPVCASCGRPEWACPGWNQPGIDFYLSLGAVQMAGWITCRITGRMFQEMAE